MSDDSMLLYTAVYDDVSTALTDLSAVEQLHRDELIGKFDAAVIDQENGQAAHRQEARPTPASRDSRGVRGRSLAAAGAPRRRERTRYQPGRDDRRRRADDRAGSRQGDRRRCARRQAVGRRLHRRNLQRAAGSAQGLELRPRAVAGRTFGVLPADRYWLNPRSSRRAGGRTGRSYDRPASDSSMASSPFVDGPGEAAGEALSDA